MIVVTEWSVSRPTVGRLSSTGMRPAMAAAIRSERSSSDTVMVGRLPLIAFGGSVADGG